MRWLLWISLLLMLAVVMARYAIDGTSAATTADVPEARERDGDLAPSPRALPQPLARERVDLEVEVVDERGDAIAGAEVVFEGADGAQAVATSDGGGRATLRGIARGDAFRVRATGFLTRAVSCAPDGDLQRVRLLVAPLLTGRVFAVGGRFVAGARVALLPAVAGRVAAPLSEHATAVADDDGRFSLPWPDLQPHDLVVTAPGFAPNVTPAISAGAQRDAPVFVRLQRGARIEGRVEVPSRSGITDRQVELWSSPPAVDRHLGASRPWRGGSLLARWELAADGSFVLADLPAGPAWLVLAEDARVAATFVALAAGERHDATLRLPAFAVVEGRTPERDVDAVFLQGDALREAPVDDDGRFRFEDVAPGRYLIGARREPFAEHLRRALREFEADGAAVDAQLLDVSAGANVPVDLSPTTAAGGQVIGDAFVGAAPAAERVVAVFAADGARRGEARVGDDGAFCVADLPPGDYSVRLLDGGGDVLAERPCRVLGGNAVLLTLITP